MSEEAQEVVEAPTKKVRIVTMQDGTQANFGVRGNVLSSLDPESNSIVFKIRTGAIINWVVPFIENLNDFQKTVYMYGLLEKVKTSLAPVKFDKLEEHINKQIAIIEKGEFNIRSLNQTGEVSLTDLQKAYAIALSKSDTSKVHLAEVDKSEVITEVLNIWETKSTAERAKLRRHPLVAFELSVIQVANGELEDL